MKPPCELAVKEFLPSLRAAIVKELSESYCMKQTDIADALGITQASVSQYLNVERAKEARFTSLEGFTRAVQKIAENIARENASKAAVLTSICNICSEIRKSDEFCQVHQDVIHIEGCDICKHQEGE
jgi:predicted transcriptional regulator